ncbi:MAG: type VII toxin-antitoxin system HepT family RNase toxin [Desulfovermiculus sp.]
MPIQPDDIIWNKAAIIERCIRRMHEEYRADPDLEDYTHVDALTLNIERACQAVIDLAMHVVARQRLGVPQSSGDTFYLLERAGYISSPLRQSLVAMTGFRNIAIHQYQVLDSSVLHYIVQKGYQDLIAFGSALGVQIEDSSS